MLVMSLLLGGCSLLAKPADIQTESPTVTITGKISVVGDRVMITSSGKITEITSRKIDLNALNGQSVSVTGEFSGTTLYVDVVK